MRSNRQTADEIVQIRRLFIRRQSQLNQLQNGQVAVTYCWHRFHFVLHLSSATADALLISWATVEMEWPVRQETAMGQINIAVDIFNLAPYLKKGIEHVSIQLLPSYISFSYWHGISLVSLAVTFYIQLHDKYIANSYNCITCFLWYNLN